MIVAQMDADIEKAKSDVIEAEKAVQRAERDVEAIRKELQDLQVRPFSLTCKSDEAQTCARPNMPRPKLSTQKRRNKLRPSRKNFRLWRHRSQIMNKRCKLYMKRRRHLRRKSKRPTKTSKQAIRRSVT